MARILLSLRLQYNISNKSDTEAYIGNYVNSSQLFHPTMITEVVM